MKEYLLLPFVFVLFLIALPLLVIGVLLAWTIDALLNKLPRQ